VLLATICSAQNRDEVTIPVMERFFEKFNALEKIAGAHVEAIKKYIRSINYYENKAKYLKETARILLEKFNGRVPSKMEELIELPGVGRKTANLVLSVIHKQDTITVDTHVHRLSNVLGLVNTKTREKTEKELEKIAPRKYWRRINRIFILWGKDVPGRDKRKLLKKLDER
jgi:endonuclease-3